MAINKNLLGPKNWREYPVYWWEGIRFRIEVSAVRVLRKVGLMKPWKGECDD